MNKSGLQTINRSNNLSYWNTQVTACRSSGMSVNKWCKEHEIPLSSYYYWQKQVYHATVEPQQNKGFVEIQIDSPIADQGIRTAVSIPFCNTEIRIHNGADENTLTALLRAIRSC